MQHQLILNPSFKESDFKIKAFDSIFLIGSCFSTEMFLKLKRRKFDVLSNPYGVLFDTLSISRAIEDIKKNNEYKIDDLYKFKDTYLSWNHHSDFNDIESQNTLNKINNSISNANSFLKKSKVVIITLGSAFSYRLINENQFVANCHKYPQNHFEKVLVSIEEIENQLAVASANVQEDFIKAQQAEDPKPEDLFTHDFAPTPITEEVGERNPSREEKVVMVDCALFAVEELMKKHTECLFYGQDVGGRLGGVFREAATLAQKFGDERVFNTPIQEAFIVGSTVGMSAVGLKPIVEVQFADYIWPGLNQLFTEVSRSCYLSNGKWPVRMILPVPIGNFINR
jgi:hypothetical protein